jgi:hypothetical protein
MLSVERARRWWLLRHDSLPEFSAGSSSSGPRALWKPDAGRAGIGVFEIPDSVVTGAHGEADWDDDRDPWVISLDRVIHWAAATVAGNLPDGWQPPSADELAAWAPPSALSVRSDMFARQATLVCKPDRLAIELELTGATQPGLSSARRAWLDDVLQSAQQRWRMVRVDSISRADNDGVTPRIEVDLSGAPAANSEALVRAALAAVQAVGRQLLETVTLLCDPTVACAAWEIHPDAISTNP